MHKRAGWTVAAALLVLCLVLGWRVVDGAAATDKAHALASASDQRSAMALVVLQVDWIGRPEADLVALAQRMKQVGALVRLDDDAVQIDEVVFRMKDQRVVGVDFLRP
jgi:hypothetical protein